MKATIKKGVQTSGTNRGFQILVKFLEFSIDPHCMLLAVVGNKTPVRFFFYQAILTAV